LSATTISTSTRRTRPTPDSRIGSKIPIHNSSLKSNLVTNSNPPPTPTSRPTPKLPPPCKTLSSLTPFLTPTAPSSSLSQPPDYKPETRPHYPGGWGSGVGAQASRVITPAVSPTRGRSGPVTPDACNVSPAFVTAFEGASLRAQFDSNPRRHPSRHSRRHPRRQAPPRGPRWRPRDRWNSRFRSRCSSKPRSLAPMTSREPHRGADRGRLLPQA